MKKKYFVLTLAVIAKSSVAELSALDQKRLDIVTKSKFSQFGDISEWVKVGKPDLLPGKINKANFYRSNTNTIRNQSTKPLTWKKFWNKYVDEDDNLKKVNPENTSERVGARMKEDLNNLKLVVDDKDLNGKTVKRVKVRDPRGRKLGDVIDPLEKSKVSLDLEKIKRSQSVKYEANKAQEVFNPMRDISRRQEELKALNREQESLNTVSKTVSKGLGTKGKVLIGALGLLGMGGIAVAASQSK